MQEISPVQTPVAPVATPSVAVEQPKSSNFLVILLSVLLFISVAIAGFFAYQTQKLVKELQGMRSKQSLSLRDEELVATKTTPEPTTEPLATSSTNATSDPTIMTSEKQKIEIAAKMAFVKKIGQEPTTKYGLSEESLKIVNNWAFGVIAVAPVGEGAGPGASYFLARKINNIWDAKIEYTIEFKEWLKISPDGLVNEDLKKMLL